ncbi:MAG: hypothetical protein ACOYOE_01480 [Chlorobium sp.]
MFRRAVKSDVSPEISTEIEQYRNLVLNAFSHDNTEKHEIRTELTSAIEAVKVLGTELKGTS